MTRAAGILPAGRARTTKPTAWLEKSYLGNHHAHDFDHEHLATLGKLPTALCHSAFIHPHPNFPIAPNSIGLTAISVYHFGGRATLGW